MSVQSINRHLNEILNNKNNWDKKPLLRNIYAEFYQRIIKRIDKSTFGHIVELGSGIGNIKQYIPEAIATDIFHNEWIDKTENAYSLKFADNTVSNIILFDVLHHLEFPAVALKEFNRVLVENGRIIIFEPDMGLLGILCYGLFHHEPLGFRNKINTKIIEQSICLNSGYYASQSNANKIFVKKKYPELIQKWKILTLQRFPDIHYIFSGGYSKSQMYPEGILPFLRYLNNCFKVFPFLFSTRLLVTIQKKTI